MSGIVVGVDGSAHSGRALEWATNEAALRRGPLTVVTVYPAVVGYLGNAVSNPEDQARSERARTVAQEATDKALAQLGESRPSSVAVRAISGDPADELLTEARDADLIVVSTRLTHHARCPVVVIPAEDRRPQA
jgi:nucleotide-binding universal stress UspA family protein